MAVLKKLREIGDNIEGFPKLISHKETENSAEFIINVSQKPSLVTFLTPKSSYYRHKDQIYASWCSSARCKSLVHQLASK